MTLTYRMEGPNTTQDIEEYIRWLGQERNIHLDPDVADCLRAADVADHEVDRVIDEAAAKFEDRA